MPDLVSILIPCHNAAAWLDEAVASAAAQTWIEREIIIVDDGSTDDSLARARRWQDRGVATVFPQAQRGAAAARNAALRQSRGQWLQYLDADDVLAPDKIARQLALGTAPDEIVSGRWARFVGSVADAIFTPEVLCRDDDPAAWVIAKLEEHAMMHPAAWLVPRALADRGGPWDESLSLDDDGEYFARLVLLARRVRYCPAAVSYYRSALAGSLSGRRSDAAWASAGRALESVCGRLLAREDSPRARRACAAALTRLAQEAYPQGRDTRRRVLARARALGGAAVTPLGGPRFQRLRRLVGWRLARRLQLLFSR